MANYETLQKKHNFIVGLFVLLGVLALVYMIAKFNGLPLAYNIMKSFVIKVEFPVVAGVQKNTPVQFCGYHVGTVIKIAAPEILEDPDTKLIYHQVVVDLAINRKYNTIPSNVQVKLMRRGLGSSYIELIVDPETQLSALDPNRPETKFLMDEMVLTGSTGTTNDFIPEELQDKLGDLIDGIIVLVENTNNLVGDPENKENLGQTIANLARITNQATTTLAQLENLASAGTTTIHNADTHIQKVASSMVTASDELTGSITELREILEKINSGEGTAGRILNDGRLYESLLDNTDQLKIVLQEIKFFVEESHKKGIPLKLK